MPIIVAHKAECDIVINGPVRSRLVAHKTFVDEARICTCGGELLDTALFTMGPPSITRDDVLEIVAANSGGVDR